MGVCGLYGDCGRGGLRDSACGLGEIGEDRDGAAGRVVLAMGETSFNQAERLVKAGIGMMRLGLFWDLYE
jgi:hypothetical protein